MALQLLRWKFKAMSVVAPALTEERAAQLFFTPRRAKTRRAPTVPGQAARTFQVTSGGESVTAWSFGEGPAVLLAHGWEGHAGQLMPLASALVRRGRRVVVFDMPAHGASTGRETNMIEMAAAIEAVAQVVGPLEAAIAHSLGGAALALATSRGLDVGRVVLIAPAAEPRWFATTAARLIGLPDARVPGMLRQCVARVGRDWSDVEIVPMVRGIEKPLLVLHDPADVEVPFSHGEAIAAAWPKGRMIATPGLGHRKVLKDAATVAKAVRFASGDLVDHA